MMEGQPLDLTLHDHDVMTVALNGRVLLSARPLDPTDLGWQRWLVFDTDGLCIGTISEERIYRQPDDWINPFYIVVHNPTQELFGHQWRETRLATAGDALLALGLRILNPEEQPVTLDLLQTRFERYLTLVPRDGDRHSAAAADAITSFSEQEIRSLAAQVPSTQRWMPPLPRTILIFWLLSTAM